MARETGWVDARCAARSGAHDQPSAEGRRTLSVRSVRCSEIKSQDSHPDAPSFHTEERSNGDTREGPTLRTAQPRYARPGNGSAHGHKHASIDSRVCGRGHSHRLTPRPRRGVRAVRIGASLSNGRMCQMQRTRRFSVPLLLCGEIRDKQTPVGSSHRLRAFATPRKKT
jgi:hypothetical protein